MQISVSYDHNVIEVVDQNRDKDITSLEQLEQEGDETFIQGASGNILDLGVDYSSPEMRGTKTVSFGYFTLVNRAEAGKLVFAQTLVGHKAGVWVPEGREATLFTIGFIGKRTGEAKVKIEGVKLVTSDAQEISSISGATAIVEVKGTSTRCCPWDVTNDCVVNIFDLVMVAKNFGLTVPPAVRQADVDNNKVVNIFDLVLIGIHFGEKCKKECSTCRSKSDVKLAPERDTVAGEILQKHFSGEVFTVNIECEDGSDKIYGFQFELGFDPDMLDVISIDEGAALKGDVGETFWMEPKADNKDGKIIGACTRVGDNSGIDCSGVLASITFKAKKSGVSKLILSKILFSDSQAMPVKKTVMLSSNIQAIQTSVINTTLFQNYPNPFNPETWIPYTLSKKAHVIIKIYNISGQLVRVLDLGEKEAGMYVSKGRAAYWDGKNDNGEEVASGVYFYQIHADDYVSTKRMVVIK
jgi:hypothetical protein